MRYWLRKLRDLIPKSRWAPITKDDTIRSGIDALEAVREYIQELEEDKRND